MGVPSPLHSPVVETFEDYLGRQISITVTFNETTRAITGITAHRDAGCLFTKVLVGVGGDGAPDSTDKAVTVPTGDTTLSAGQLAALASKGLATAEDFDALQITAGK